MNTFSLLLPVKNARTDCCNVTIVEWSLWILSQSIKILGCSDLTSLLTIADSAFLLTVALSFNLYVGADLLLCLSYS